MICFDGGIQELVVGLDWEHDERKRFDRYGSSFSSIERLSFVVVGLVVEEFEDERDSVDVDGRWTFFVLSLVSFNVEDTRA